MSNKWIRKGDKVVVLAGNEKGKTGNVLMRKEDRVVIEGLNIRKKHVKPKQRMQSGIVEKEGSVHISNIGLCNDAGEAIKVKVKVGDNGLRQLVYLEKGKEVLFRDVKKKKI